MFVSKRRRRVRRHRQMLPFNISVANMRLHQRTSVKSFGKLRARQNSLPDSIHIGARCNQQPRNINVAC